MPVFGFKGRPRHFISDPRPWRDRHVSAPRDPGDPANPAATAPPGVTWGVRASGLASFIASISDSPRGSQRSPCTENGALRQRDSGQRAETRLRPSASEPLRGAGRPRATVCRGPSPLLPGLSACKRCGDLRELGQIIRRTVDDLRRLGPRRGPGLEWRAGWVHEGRGGLREGPGLDGEEEADAYPRERLDCAHGTAG